MSGLMTSRERVISAFNRTGYDRIPVKHEATPEVNRMLMDHFGLKNTEQLLRVVGDDFRYVDPVYVGPALKTFPDGSVEDPTRPPEWFDTTAEFLSRCGIAAV